MTAPAMYPSNNSLIKVNEHLSMRFNLFDLHDSAEDINVRRLIRVYSVVPKYSQFKSGPWAGQAIRVTSFLRKVNEKLKKEIGSGWKREWLNNIGYKFALKSIGDWFIGRASVPLIALKKLEVFGLDCEVSVLLNNCNYFSCTTRAPYKLPHFLTPDLAYLTGAILGDGHIRRTEDKISFEVSEKWLSNKFIEKVVAVFEQKLRESIRIGRGKDKYLARFDNKSAKRLFTKIIGIPSGKKSHIITVPELIKASSKECQTAFLEGVFDTDGGSRGKNRLGLTSASKQFRDGIIDLLEVQGINAFKDEWVNKMYNRSYYGLRLSKGVKPSFMQE